MSKPGEFTLTEIFSQPDAWRSALETLRSNRARLEQALQTNYAEVIFTGCGSTYYAALAAAAAYATLTGRPARGVPGSELWLNPELYYTQPGRYLLAPISRSGETSGVHDLGEGAKLVQCPGRLHNRILWQQKEYIA